MKLSIIITFYNEESVILKTHQSVSKQVKKMLGNEIEDYELIYIDDGSSDNTLSIIKDISHHNSQLKYISFSRNFGRESAILSGFQYANGDAALVMDGDLQHPPSLIPMFIESYKAGFDIVSGKRDRQGETFFNNSFARMFYIFSNWLMDVHLTDGKSEFRLLSRRAYQQFASLPEYNRFNKGLYEWLGFKEKVIAYPNHVRKIGKSKYNFRKSINYALQGIISFNDKPLRVAIKFGLSSVFLALIYLSFEFVKYIKNPNDVVSGYFTTIAAITLFSGVQLISIGVLGEYIGKIYYEVKKRPHYIINETNIEEVKRR